MKVLTNIPIELSFDEIVMLLQKEGTKRKKPNKQLILEIQEQISLAKKYIDTKAIYDIFDSKILYPRDLFTLSEKTILAIVTISNELEEKISELLAEGSLSQGVILDAIASQAAEDLAEKVYQLIIKEHKELVTNKQYTKRFSPGYCRWELAEGQKMIFDLLPAKAINVRLSPSMLMIPRKSVSFAINIGRKVEEGLGEKECCSCDMNNCEYRREC